MTKTAQLVSDFVELFYSYKRYLIRRSELDNKDNKILMLPDGTAFDLTQMYIDTTDKHGNPLGCHRLSGSNLGYETWGQLPRVGVIKAREAEVKPKTELYQVRLFYHPSSDHIDPSPDNVEEYFTLSTSASEAIDKVVSKLKSQLQLSSHYQNDAVWKGIPDGISPETALSILKAAGLRIVG